VAEPIKDILDGETVLLFAAKRDDMGYKKSWELIVGESYKPAKDKQGNNFPLRIYHEHAKLLEKVGCVLPDYGNTDYSKAPYSVVISFDTKHNARRIIGAFNSLGEKVTLEEANKRPAPIAPELYKGKFRSVEEIARMKAEEAKVIEAPKLAIVPSPVTVTPSGESLEATLARLLADAETVYAKMPTSAIAAQVLYHARYLNDVAKKKAG